jgi:predicted outer membrane protein
LATLAQDLGAAHTAALEELRTAAQASGHASLVPHAVNWEQAKQIDALREASGSRLQQLYTRLQESAHEDLVQLHVQYEKHGNVPELMKYAGRYRPTETDHLKRIREGALRPADADGRTPASQ